MEKFVDNSDVVKNKVAQAIPRILLRMGNAVEGTAKNLCPVDTGRLRNSISNTAKIDELAVYVGTNVEYAEYVERGTLHMDAQPYLKPAVVQNKRKCISIVEDELQGT